MPTAKPARIPAPGPRSPAPQKGFTLLEMLAVIVLIGIAVTAVSISVSHGLASARVRAAGKDLSAALRYTRAQAIVHAQAEVLSVDLARRSYRTPGHPAVTLPRGMQVLVTSASQDQSGGHIARIRFFPDGSSTGGRITLRRGEQEWHINVAWLTGAVSVVTRVKS